MKALGKEAVSVNREEVDLRLVEQLTDHEQLEALVQILKYMKLHMFDGKRTLRGSSGGTVYSYAEKRICSILHGRYTGKSCTSEKTGNLCCVKPLQRIIKD